MKNDIKKAICDNWKFPGAMLGLEHVCVRHNYWLRDVSNIGYSVSFGKRREAGVISFDGGMRLYNVNGTATIYITPVCEL